MHWNYRIIKDKKILSLASVYYIDGKPQLYSEVDMYYTSKKALKENYDKMGEAFDRPILNVEDITK